MVCSGEVGGKVGAMRRCAVVLLGVLLAVGVGCARQSPVPTTPTASPVVAALRIGVTPDPTTGVLAELYLQALVAKGREASVVEVADDPNTQVSRLMAGELDLVPTFAWSAAQALEVDTSDPQRLLSDLAAALDDEAAVLQPSAIDRAWRYVSTQADVSLQDITATTAVVSGERWRTAPDGQSGLASIYGATPSVKVVDDAEQRLTEVKAGAIGVFDATDPQVADAALKPVDDPKTMIAADPHTALLRLERADDDTVLDVVQQLHTMLDNAAILGIRTRAAAVGVPAAVTEWLQTHPLR